MRVWDSRWGCEVGGVYESDDGRARAVVAKVKPSYVLYHALGRGNDGLISGARCQQRFRQHFRRWVGSMTISGALELWRDERFLCSGERRALERQRDLYEGVLRRMTTAGSLEPGDEISDAYLNCKGDPYEKLQAMAEAGLRLGSADG